MVVLVCGDGGSVFTCVCACVGVDVLGCGCGCGYAWVWVWVCSMFLVFVACIVRLYMFVHGASKQSRGEIKTASQ